MNEITQNVLYQKFNIIRDKVSTCEGYNTQLLK